MKMQEEGVKRAGAFTLADGKEVQGELCLNGAATRLDLYSDKPFDTHASRDIVGRFHDRSRVSLVHCITTQGPGGGNLGEDQYHLSSVFPHFVIFGDQHIRSSEQTICGASFTFDDATTVFRDFDAFGMVLKNARAHLERIIEGEGNLRKVEIGEHPYLFYFTGKHEIFAVDTLLGKISAWHGLSYAHPGSKGIRADNTICLNIEFHSERIVEEAVNEVLELLRFLGILAGRPQRVSKLKLLTKAPGVEHPVVLDVYWCMSPRREADGSSEPHSADLPIRALETPDEFTNVLKNWLERSNEWRSARARFATAFAYQNRYDVDRIVGAANMFDIMPSTAYPATVALPIDLDHARIAARNAFQALPASPERDSVLGALGRLGTPTLKRKVRSRAKLITDRVGARFPDLDLVVDQAVDCRNYYVHGSVAKMDYSKHFYQVQFFTDTLEFVFVASDFVESGWDIEAWAKRITSLSHPFGQYRANYKLQLSELKKLL